MSGLGNATQSYIGNGYSDKAAGVTPRDISTRSNLATIAARLEAINAHLNGMLQDNWGEGISPPTPGGQTKPSMLTHDAILSEISFLLSQIESKVEFISARL